MKNPHVSEVWVNFTRQLGLFIRYGQRTLFSHVAGTNRLKVRCDIYFAITTNIFII